MRLWSLHPQYLDQKGLVALWREGLLAQAVLAGNTRGYRNHPQLSRFRVRGRPDAAIAAYLAAVCEEAHRRGYRFDETKVVLQQPATTALQVTEGQIAYEWNHLAAKLMQRAPQWWSQFAGIEHPRPHPLFEVVPGAIADWEAMGNGKRGRVR